MKQRALFPTRAAWHGDPIRPDRETPTPWEIVNQLSREKREERVCHLMEMSSSIYNEAFDLATADGHTVVASVLLFSGGNDSTVLGHLFRNVATHAAHANTGIGIEGTRQFVRDVCGQWGLPLLEKHPPTSYRELVIERGFPGPPMHFKMFQRLKDRCLRQVQRELVRNPRKQRVIYIAGRRRAESARRADIPLFERIGSVVWASPIALWTKPDMSTYRRMMGDVPTNPVAETLGMSGECLCGAFAKPGEIEQIEQHFPETAALIHDLECAVRAAGHPEPFCVWGHGQGAASPNTGQLCTSCSINTDPLWELVEDK